MLAVKNGLRSIWRSPGKTILIFLLILALTAMLALGLCVYSAVAEYLDACNAYYQTIGVLEYVGAAYPDSHVYDTKMADALQQLDLSSLTRQAGVLAWGANRSALGSIENLHRGDPQVYNEDMAVLIVSNLFWEDHTGAYQGIIQSCPYSFYDNSGNSVFLSPGALEGLEIEPGRHYVFTGRYIQGQNSYVWFLPEPWSLQGIGSDSGQTVPAGAPLPDGSLSEDNVYYQIAQVMLARNNGVRVQMTDDIDTFYPFQQQELYLKEGRSFTAEEYAQGAKVCMLPEYLAQQLQLSLGDTVQLSMYFTQSEGIYDAYAPGDTPDLTDRYTVVGIFNTVDTYTDWVFVPDSAAYTAADCPTGFTVGQFQLDNRLADQFYQNVEHELPSGFRLEIYDQGYSVTVAPFQELLRIAQIFLAVCCLVVLAVLGLFGYLFVYRQREAAETMLALGSGKPHVFGYFAAGSGLIALLAAGLGAVVSSLLERRVMAFVADFAAKYQTTDLRYSNANLSISKELTFSPATSTWLFALAAGVLLALALLSCALFTRSVLAARKRKRPSRQRAPKHLGKSSHLAGGLLKYPLLSIRRGGIRSFVVVLTAIVVAVFLGQLTTTADVYRDKLQYVYDHTTLRGHITDSKGKRIGGLTMPAASIQALYDTGLLDTLNVTSSGAHYKFEGVRQDAGGTLYNVEPIPIPTGEFALATMVAQFAAGSRFVGITSLTDTPEAFFSGPPSVTWLEGYDESCLRGEDPAICLLSSRMMAQEGIELGDIIRIMVGVDAWPRFYELEYLVVGSYVPQGGEDTLYTPLDFTFPVGGQAGTTVPRDPFPLESPGDQPFALRKHSVAFLEDNTGLEFLSAHAKPDQIVWAHGEDLSKELVKLTDNYCFISWELWEELQPLYRFKTNIVSDSGLSLEYQIIGIFQKNAGEKADIYCSPVTSYTLESKGIYDEETVLSQVIPYTVFESSIFTFSNPARLSELKDAIEELGFLGVNQANASGGGMSRTYLVIYDKDFHSTVNSLNRQIQYLDALYTCLYVLTGLIGLVLSYLLVAARKRELAIMRGLGAPHLRIFTAFFLEQFLLSLLGCGAGFGIWAALGRPSPRLHWIMTGIFLACWLLGSCISTLHLQSSKALAVLSDKE